jgi:hypothetical protein
LFLEQACCVHLFTLPPSHESWKMKIHSTPYACYVSLRNGLTLELTFDSSPPQHSRNGVSRASDHPTFRSAGVWMFHEEVLIEARIGLA